MAGGGGGRALPETPTWAVAVVCAVIVLVSVAMEHGLHNLSHVRARARGVLISRVNLVVVVVVFL